MATAAALTVALRAKTAAFDRKMKHSGKRVNQFSATAKKAGAALGAYFGARELLRFTKESILAFAKFEGQMALVHTMLDKGTSKYLPAYSKQVQKLAVVYGESTTALSKGLYDILSAGIDAADAMYVLEIATQAAVGGATDAAIAVDGLTSLLNAYQLSASRAGYASDIMFAIVRRGKITFGELAANIGKVAPMARASGMSMEQMGAAIATLTRQGLSAEEATTRLNAIMKIMPGSVNDLYAAMTKFKGKDLASIIGEIPNVRAAAGIAALAADLEGLAKDLKTMADAEGERLRAFEKRYHTHEMQIKRLGSQWDRAKVKVGEYILESKHWSRYIVLSPGFAVAMDLLFKKQETLAEGMKNLKAESAKKVAGAKSEAALAAEAMIREAEVKRLLKIEKAYDKINAMLEKQIALHGKSEREAIIYQLRQMRASKEQIAVIQFELDHLDELDRRKRAADAEAQDIKNAAAALKTYYQMWSDLNDELVRMEGTKYMKEFLRFEKLADLGFAVEQIRDIMRMQDKVSKMAEGQRIFEQTRTTLERYEQQITRLDDLLRAGAINWDTYGRAVRNALEQRDRGGLRTGDRFGEFRNITDVIGLPGRGGVDPAATRDAERNRLLTEQLAIARKQFDKVGIN